MVQDGHLLAILSVCVLVQCAAADHCRSEAPMLCMTASCTACTGCSHLMIIEQANEQSYTKPFGELAPAQAWKKQLQVCTHWTDSVSLHH